VLNGGAGHWFARLWRFVLAPASLQRPASVRAAAATRRQSHLAPSLWAVISLGRQPMPNYLTPEGAKKLQAELNQLLNVDRSKVVQEVADAAAQGDRSENAEYIYGKKKLREIDRRIRFLTKRLDAAVVVKQEEGAHAEVRFGATVEVEDENGKRSTYLILGPDEASPSSGSISFQSPLGRALMKRKVGDVVSVVRPAGEIELEIKAIRYE
jgi:transcription elongation factor GreB